MDIDKENSCYDKIYRLKQIKYHSMQNSVKKLDKLTKIDEIKSKISND